MVMKCIALLAQENVTTKALRYLSIFAQRLGTVPKYRSVKTTIRIAVNTIERYEYRDQMSSMLHLFRILQRAIRFVYRISVVVLS